MSREQIESLLAVLNRFKRVIALNIVEIHWDPHTIIGNLPMKEFVKKSLSNWILELYILVSACTMCAREMNKHCGSEC